jgi:hypothetical protein
MSALDETTIRTELHQAVDVLDPLPPPFGAVLARGRRRRRTRWVLGLVALAATAGIAVVAVIVILPVGGGQTVTPAVQPPPLRPYARHNGGVPVKKSTFALDWVAGPVTTSTGRYGGFVTAKTLVTVKLVHGQWHTESTLALNEGPPSFRLGLQVGPTLPGGIPSFITRGKGGDVSYFGAVGTEIAGRWTYAHFGRCGKAGCGANTNAVSYLRMTGAGLISEQNDCTPDCASGTEYRIRWTWNATKAKFETASVTPLKR